MHNLPNYVEGGQLSATCDYLYKCKLKLTETGQIFRMLQFHS